MPDPEAKTGRLVDISILIGGAVEQVVKKPLSSLSFSVISLKRRMRSDRNEGELCGGTLVGGMGFGVHERLPGALQTTCSRTLLDGQEAVRVHIRT
jgi:hypothetical protein